jgi:hypothetical protein
MGWIGWIPLPFLPKLPLLARPLLPLLLLLSAPILNSHAFFPGLHTPTLMDPRETLREREREREREMFY